MEVEDVESIAEPDLGASTMRRILGFDVTKAEFVFHLGSLRDLALTCRAIGIVAGLQMYSSSMIVIGTRRGPGKVSRHCMKRQLYNLGIDELL